MEASYLKASANDTLLANPRQIYYVARLRRCRTGQTVSKYFFARRQLPDWRPRTRT